MSASARYDVIGDPALSIRGLDVGYDDRVVLSGIDLDIARGAVTTIIGPNGCGKSTLLKTLGKLLTPTRGSVTVDGRSVTALKHRELARSLAMLPQTPVAPEGMTVADLVARGRLPHQPWYRQWSRDDEEIAAQAMRDTGVAELAGRPLEQLSGGQRQRAWIAMTLAQQTDILLLDEPTTHLDLAHAVEVLDLVVRLRAETGRTIVVVLHDLALAARYSDELVVLKDGAVRAQGVPAELLTAQMLDEVFGLRARVFPDPVDNLPTVVPVGHA